MADSTMDDFTATARLQRLSTQLVRSGELNSLLHEILSAAADLSGTDKGNIQLYNPSTRSLRIVVHQGLGRRLVEHFADHGWAATCDAAAEKNARVIVEDVAQETAFQGTVELAIVLEDGIRAIQSTPLVTREGRLLGMLNNHYRVPGRPSDRVLGYIDVLARMAADLIERSQAEAALRDADRRKDEFLATLAHELRGPLAPLRNTLEILKRVRNGDPLVRQAHDTMERQLRQLTRLVDDLMDVSRITHNKIELRKEKLDLASIVHQAVEACQPLATSANLRVRVHAPAEPIYVRADPIRLAQVFGNLLNNACKYTPADGDVSVDIRREGGEVVVSISDTGVGIPPDQLDCVFELFTQIDLPFERTLGGLGIGLTLVKQLVEMHGGTVTAHSEGVQRGAEFIVRLPILEDRRVEARTVSSKQPTASAQRILIVDDNADTVDSLARLLTLSGNETQTAHDGVEAMQVADSFRPNIVLLDIGLPKFSGLDVCRRIREQPWGRAMVMVAMTGLSRDEDRQRSKDAGFNHHLVKPVEYDALLSVLAEHCSAGR